MKSGVTGSQNQKVQGAGLGRGWLRALPSVSLGSTSLGVGIVAPAETEARASPERRPPDHVAMCQR